jgi:cytochrome c oxidase cbb3-type subunit 4
MEMPMDVNDLRSLVTVLSLVAFTGIIAWVFWPRHRAGFEAAASMALQDDGRQGAERSLHE